MNAQEKQQAREYICTIGHRMYQNGFVAANDGNISVRTGENQFLITPTGVSKADLTPDMMLEIDGAGNLINGSTGKSSIETFMHLGVLNSQSDLCGVVHAHSPYAVWASTAFDRLGDPITADSVFFVGNVPVVPFYLPGSRELAEAVAKQSAQYNCALMSNHGAITWGKTLRAAWFALEALEQYCKQLFFKSVSGVGRSLSGEQSDLMCAMRAKSGNQRGGEHMPEKLTK